MFIFLPTIIAQVFIREHYGFGDVLSLGTGIQRLTYPAFSIATLAVVLYFVIGAFKLLISHGDKGEVAAARAMITHAIIGFVLLIFMYLIFQFIPQWFGFQKINVVF